MKTNTFHWSIHSFIRSCLWRTYHPLSTLKFWGWKDSLQWRTEVRAPLKMAWPSELQQRRDHPSWTAISKVHLSKSADVPETLALAVPLCCINGTWCSQIGEQREGAFVYELIILLDYEFHVWVGNFQSKSLHLKYTKTVLDQSFIKKSWSKE